MSEVFFYNINVCYADGKPFPCRQSCFVTACTANCKDLGARLNKEGRVVLTCENNDLALLNENEK